MSERELQRTLVLALSPRQVHRLLQRHPEHGAGGLAHRARGRPANNRIDQAVREQATELVRTLYPDFGPTLAAEALAERRGLVVSCPTLRGWMTDAGLWLARQQRRLRQPRPRRERPGELVQIDGGEHRWFEGRADPCALLVFIDDATGRLMQLRFVVSESVFRCFDALQDYVMAYGRPLAFRSNMHSVLRVAKKEAKAGSSGSTAPGRIAW